MKDATGQALGYFYFEEEPGRRSAAELLTKDETRRMAASDCDNPDGLQGDLRLWRKPSPAQQIVIHCGCALAAKNAECLSDVREELLYHVVELGNECDRLGLNSRIARVVKFVQLAEVRQIFQHERVAF